MRKFKALHKHVVDKDKYHLYNYKLMVCQDVLKQLLLIKEGKEVEEWFDFVHATCQNQGNASEKQYGVVLDEVDIDLYCIKNGHLLDHVITIDWINKNESLSNMDFIYPIKVDRFKGIDMNHEKFHRSRLHNLFYKDEQLDARISLMSHKCLYIKDVMQQFSDEDYKDFSHMKDFNKRGNEQ